MNSVVAYLQSTWYETGGKRNEWCACLPRAMSIKGNGVPQRAGSPTYIRADVVVSRLNVFPLVFQESLQVHNLCRRSFSVPCRILGKLCFQIIMTCSCDTCISFLANFNAPTPTRRLVWSDRCNSPQKCPIMMEWSPWTRTMPHVGRLGKSGFLVYLRPSRRKTLCSM